MLGTNSKISEGLSVLATIDPISQGVGSAATGWVGVANLFKLLALIDVGVFGASATVDANIQQAQDSSGTGAKAIGSGKAITQLLAAGGNNRQALINLDVQELDTNNNFYYVKLTITVGTAASLVSGALVGTPRFEDASAFNQTGVAQIV
jgi:hypothetical protein